jgi:integrase
MSEWIEDRGGRGQLRWRGRYRTRDGRVVSRSFELRRQAQAWLDAETAKLVRGEWVDPRAGDRTFEAWAADVMASRVDLAPSTRSRDESYLRSLILPRLGPSSLSSIEPADLRRLVAELNAGGKAPATVRKAYQLAALILDRAVSDGLIPRTPARDVALPSDRGREPMRFLELDEVAALADAVDPAYRPMVALGVWAGLRLGEAAGLKVEDLDLLRRTVSIRRSLSDEHGFGPPKTPASRATLTLPPSLVEDLAAHLSEYGPRPQGVVFAAPAGGQLVSGTPGGGSGGPRSGRRSVSRVDSTTSGTLTPRC